MKQNKEKKSNRTNKTREKKQKQRKNNKNQEIDNNKLEKRKKAKFSKRHPVISFLIKLFLVLFLIVAIIGAGVVVGLVYGVWGQDLEINPKELELKGNSVIYDSKNNVKAELSGDENRKIIKLEEMAEYLPKAYVAIEDERFYSHSGVDLKRTFGAIGTFILHKGSSSYGGSTITQQLVKNITEEKEKTGIEGITRKIKEWAKAYKIERMLSKNQILELYLNIIFVGGEGNLHGVELGAEYYFNKKAKDLSLEECAFLAGINNRPNYYNPYEKKAEYEKDENKKKRINNRTKTVLMKMLETGAINQEEYDKAVENVEKGLNFKKGANQKVVYSYITDAVITRVIEDFVNEKGWTKEYATTHVYGGGLKIYTTEDPDIQKKLEKVMVDNAKTYQRNSVKHKKDKVKSQAATVIIDNKTGNVVALYGELGEKTTSRGLNRATQSTRSTGSSIKPLAELVPGLEEKILTPSTMYLDVKTEFKDGANKWTPKNQGRYTGEAMSVRKATGKSQNVPFVKMIAEINVETAKVYLKKMGITTLDDKNDASYSLGLGGLYKGITPLEMAGAYASIENDGTYRTPLLYTKVVDSDGEIEIEPKQEKVEVCSKQTAYLVKDLLKSVVEDSYGTAPYCKISGIDVAAKTGTTNDDKDRWLCGFTNYYTGATWYGFDDPEEVNYSGNPAGQIWAAVMKSLHKDKKDSKFEKPKGIVTVKVCSKTGLKATSKCSSTYSEIFAEGNIPESCDESGHAVEVCKESNLLATEFCPEVTTEISSYILPKERLNLWKSERKYSTAPTEKCNVHNAETAKQNAQAPTIKLIGSSNLTLEIGASYVEQGATATDAKDGDITGKIQISGSVNTSKAGTYTITYRVKNSAEKETSVTRTVIIADKNATPEPAPAPEPVPEPEKPNENSGETPQPETPEQPQT